MKSFSAATTLASQRLWIAEQLLLKWEFTAPTAKTLRFSDAHRADTIAQEWLAFVKRWGAIDEALATMTTAGKPQTFTVELANNRPIAGRERLSDLIRTPANTVDAWEWAFAKVTVYALLDPSHGVGDEVPLGAFYVEDTPDISEEVVRVRLSDRSLALEDQMKIYRITADDFPSAHESAIGRDIVVPVGVGLKNLPAYPIAGSAQTTLTRAVSQGEGSSVGPGSCTLPVQDTTGFAASGNCLIDTVARQYTSKTATSLQLVGRMPASFAEGTVVYSLNTGPKAYRFLAGEVPSGVSLGGVTAVKVNRAPRIKPSWEIDTTLVSGRRLLIINFDGAEQKVVEGSTTLRGNTGAWNGAVIGAATQTFTFAVTPQQLAANLAAVAVERKLTIQVLATSGVWAGFKLTHRTEHGDTKVLWSTDEGGVEQRTAAPPKITKNLFWTTGTYVGADTLTLTVESTSSAAFQLKITAYTLTVKTAKLVSTNQLSRTVVDADVTVDVNGVIDDASGSISGTPNLPLELPADITKFAMLHLFPGVVAADLGSTWSTTRTSQADAGLKWAMPLGRMKFSKFREKVGLQGRAALYLDGLLWEYRYRATPGAADRTLDRAKHIHTASALKRTRRVDIRTSLNVYSHRDWTQSGSLGDIYTRVKVYEDLTQPGLADRIAEDLELDWIASVPAADAIGGFELSWRKRQRFEREVVAWQNALDLEKLDFVAFSNDALLTAHGGAALIFEVRRKRYELDEDNPARIRLGLIEANA